MTKKASKQSKKGKGKTGKLKLNKETVKDLNPEDSSEVRGGFGIPTIGTCVACLSKNSPSCVPCNSVSCYKGQC